MILGLTGGIGSGKSTIAEVLRVLGHPVFEADLAGRQVLESDPLVVEAVTELLGSEVYANGKADRKAIAQRVFADHSLLEKLNGIVHPAVGRSWQKWQQEHSKAPMVVREAAILFESGTYKDCDKVLTVNAPESIRLQRVMARDSAIEKEVRARMARQWTDSERCAKADAHIVNDGIQPVIPQVLAVLKGWQL